MDLPLQGRRSINLPEKAAAHLGRVLRLRPGDEIVLFDGRGGEYSARLERIDRKVAVARITGYGGVERESALRITLVQGISRGERMDLTVQKATELGVNAIAPVLTRRSVVRLDAERAQRRTEHWRAVAASACEQCGRNRLPEVLPPRTLDDYFESRDGTTPGLLPSVAGGLPMRSLDDPGDRVAILIGPEGGLTAEEQETAKATGFVGVTLGPRVLRTETAALTAITLAQDYWGDLGTTGPVISEA